MDGYRSKVKVHEVKNVHRDIPLTSESLVCGPGEEETQEYDVGCFQSVCVFLHVSTSILIYYSLGILNLNDIIIQK